MGIQALRPSEGKPAAQAPRPRSLSTSSSGRTSIQVKNRLVYVMTQNKLPISRFYRVFGLRQGTMMIAMHDLMWSSFIVFLLVLATAHNRQACHMVEVDIEEHVVEEHVDHGGSYYMNMLETAFLEARDEVQEHVLGTVQNAVQGAAQAEPERIPFEHATPGQGPTAAPGQGPTASPGQGLTATSPGQGPTAAAPGQGQAIPGPANKTAHAQGLLTGQGQGDGTPGQGHGLEQGRKRGAKKVLAPGQGPSLVVSQTNTPANHEAENSEKMHEGLHLATVMTMVMVFCISMAGVDMIASMLLLAGALLKVRQLLMPWLSLRLIEFLLLLASTLILLYYHPHNLMFLKLITMGWVFTGMLTYHWLVAYSFHEQLCRLERTGLITHTTRPSSGSVRSQAGHAPRRQGHGPRHHAPHAAHVPAHSQSCNCLRVGVYTQALTDGMIGSFNVPVITVDTMTQSRKSGGGLLSRAASALVPPRGRVPLLCTLPQEHAMTNAIATAPSAFTSPTPAPADDPERALDAPGSAPPIPDATATDPAAEPGTDPTTAFPAAPAAPPCHAMYP